MDGRIGIRRIEEVRPHRWVRSLECARLGGFEVVVPGGRHTEGEEVVYLPRGAVLPGTLAARLMLEGAVEGAGYTVEPLEVEGELSEGVLVPLGTDPDLAVPGTSAAQILGVGYAPMEEAGAMEGAVAPTVPMALPRWDPEDWRWDPGALAGGGRMAAVELLEGTQAVVAWRLRGRERRPYLATAAMVAQGLCAPQWEAGDRPPWHRALEGPAARLREGAERLYIRSPDGHGRAHAMAWIGVVVGPGMGGPGYGREAPEWIAVGARVQGKEGGRWLALPMDEMARRAQAAGVGWARTIDPVEVHGPVTSAEVRRVQALAEGPSPTGGAGQRRAGVVVRHPAGLEVKIPSMEHTMRRARQGAEPGRRHDG